MSADSTNERDAQQRTRDPKTRPEVIVDKVDTENSRINLRKDSQLNILQESEGDSQNGGSLNKVAPNQQKTETGFLEV